ncbi:MAG: hypothetical protein RJA68_824, partial [Actinomycetota bacterium]
MFDRTFLVVISILSIVFILQSSV